MEKEQTSPSTFYDINVQKTGLWSGHGTSKGLPRNAFSFGGLLKVCILALDNENLGNHHNIPEPNAHIQMVLELAVQLLPLEEAAFLDHMQTLLKEKEQPSN